MAKPDEAPAPDAAPAAADPAPAAQSVPDLAAVVDRWWADLMPGSALARNTEDWNHVSGAVPELKRRLAAALKGSS